MTFNERLGHHYSTLTSAQQQVAEFVMAAPAELAFSTVEHLAEQIGVSPTTIVRLAVALSYSGYSEMQAAARESLRARITPALRLEQVTGETPPLRIIRQTLEFQASVIRHADEALDEETVSQVIDALGSARRVFVVGFGTTFSTAFYFSHGLAHVVPFVELLDRDDLVGPVLARATNEDLLIAFSFPRYRRITIEIVEVAKERGVPVIAFTDSPISPVYPLATWSLICPYEQTHTPVASPLGHLAIADAVLASLSAAKMQENRGETLRNVKETERVHDFLKVWERP